jgi:hypothetical protein
MLLRVAAMLAVLLASCGPFAPHSHPQCRSTLVIRQFPARTELARYCIPGNGCFSLSFIHSVSQTPVRDDYRVEAGCIVQVAETFQTHEAGLPSLEQEADALEWEWQDGQFLLRMQRPIHHLVMRTDRQYRNRLHLADRTIDLNQWDNQALELSIENHDPLFNKENAPCLTNHSPNPT